MSEGRCYWEEAPWGFWNTSNVLVLELDGGCICVLSIVTKPYIHLSRSYLQVLYITQKKRIKNDFYFSWKEGNISDLSVGSLWIVFSYFPQLLGCDIYSSAMLWWSQSFLCTGASPSGLWRQDFCLTVSRKGIRDIKSPPLTYRESKGSWRLYHCASKLSCFLPMECLSFSTPLIKKIRSATWFGWGNVSGGDTYLCKQRF